MPGKSDDTERFWSYVVKGDGCWEWTGTLSSNGYGKSWFSGRLVRAHRVSWALVNGPVPAGMCVCHHCDNRVCVRPDHLFIGTYRDNVLDKEHKGRGNHPRGSSAGRALVTEVDVVEIRRLAEGGMCYHDIGPSYGLSKQAVGSIVRRQSWRHV